MMLHINLIAVPGLRRVVDGFNISVPVDGWVKSVLISGAVDTPASEAPEPATVQIGTSAQFAGSIDWTSVNPVSNSIIAIAKVPVSTSNLQFLPPTNIQIPVQDVFVPAGSLIYCSVAVGTNSQFLGDVIVNVVPGSASLEPRGSMVAQQPTPIALPKQRTLARAFRGLVGLAAAIEFRKHVIKADDALACCERQGDIISVELGGILSGLLSALESWTGTESLALVPGLAGGVRVGAATVQLVTAADVAAMSAGGPIALGAVVIASAAVVSGIVRQTVTYDILTVVAQTLEQYFVLRRKPPVTTATAQQTPSDCVNCIGSRMLTQAHKRMRETVRINRRL